MKLFLFEYLDHVSENYHDEGGLVIVAENKEDAVRQVEAMPNVRISEDEWNSVIEYELAQSYKPKVYVFPDAGCC